MLEHSFCHIPRVGVGTEERYWLNGIRSWDDALSPSADRFLGNRAAWVRQHVEDSMERLAAHDALHFQRGLPAAQHWRMFRAFRDDAAYLDIETTGLTFGEDHITSIALYGHGEVKTFVHGRNLEDFQDEILKYSLLVTYNGKTFDVPFIERSFGMKLAMAHIDLRYVLKKLGFSGGLKRCEKAIGLSRDELEGVDGYFAVLLWNEYQATGDEAVLETLLAYNAADVVSLEALLVHAWNRLAAGTPFACEGLELPAPKEPVVPHCASIDVVERLRRKYGLARF
ncbi:hypothetical protein GGQ74_000971 [Desulfobaculum xiamenense]|uniref:YprB ribonuclease H-like domain-containing protein n=1 Tax=Desulfobaculum xiamenense TaxID=995050 RepID=A0A846QGH1_9BACT|nr:ribonuclease H-like domain-containing protein [Desulfobaculum xiamenense]NJB67331.1 hypothetical protein [Desulfobaculum xiamenense]